MYIDIKTACAYVYIRCVHALRECFVFSPVPIPFGATSDTIKKRENGYFTVEAALIFPMVLLFTVMMIFLAFYSYDRCILEQSAYEAALRGAGNHIKSAQEAYAEAYHAADTLVEGKLFAMHDFCYDVSVSADFVTVNYHCVVNMPLMGWLYEYVSGIDLTLDISADAGRFRPTRTVRDFRVINKLINEISQ